MVSRELEDHFVGRVGLFRNQPGDILIESCGCFGDRRLRPGRIRSAAVERGSGRTLIHIDELPADIDNHYQPALELRGDIAATCRELTRMLAGLRLSDAAAAAIAEQRTALVQIDDEARAHPRPMRA